MKGKAVMRLGGERVCMAFPPLAETGLFLNARKGTAKVNEGDDAVDGMALYEKGGAVCTWCGEYALYDLQSDELDVNCLACIAQKGTP